MHSFMERVVGPGFWVEKVVPCGVVALIVKARRKRDRKEMLFVYVMVGERRGLHKVDGDLEGVLRELGVIKSRDLRLGGVSRIG